MVSHIIRSCLDRQKTTLNILDVHSFRGADNLVAAKFRESISLSKRARQNFDLERFHLKKLDDVEVKEKYQVKM
jgi:hypothetical protein